MLFLFYLCYSVENMVKARLINWYYHEKLFKLRRSEFQPEKLPIFAILLLSLYPGESKPLVICDERVMQVTNFGDNLIVEQGVWRTNIIGISRHILCQATTPLLIIVRVGFGLTHSLGGKKKRKNQIATSNSRSNIGSAMFAIFRSVKSGTEHSTVLESNSNFELEDNVPADTSA